MKKIYRRPVLVVHGGATEQTKGRHGGDCYDWNAFRWCN